MGDKCNICDHQHKPSDSNECYMCKYNDVSHDPCMDNYKEKIATKEERMLYGIYSGVYDDITCKEFRELFD